MLGAVLYALGLVLSALATTPLQMQALEVLVGFGIAGVGFGVILAIVGRAAAPEQRSMSLGIATAIGSAGQVVGPPVAEGLLQVLPWQGVFLVLAGVILASMLALPFLRSPAAAGRAELEESLGSVLKRAFRDPSYTMIWLGFFSCGYQLAFITAHFPAMIAEYCGPIDPQGLLYGLGITTTTALGAAAIAVIGLFNIIGSVASGWLGARFTRKYLLAAIYAGRTAASALFILLPITPASVLVYAAVMGALWLATVPLTAGLVAHIWGLRYMGTLYGFVFLSHQIGSFLGAWLGGQMYDTTGNYTLVWWIGVGVGAFSALVHLPVQERRTAPVGAPA
jgi:predicted MFS family arabinose efflux permease